MRRLILAALVLAALACAPVALAASSPTVSAGAATGIGDTVATVHGDVNPNGLATTYQFEYGLTSALGKVSPSAPASAGAGVAAVAEARTLTGLSPDSTYYYDLVANNGDGTSRTPIKTFKTTGNPAPLTFTDPATGVSRYAATLVGTINPDNQATTYFFEYGLTTSYGLQTAVGTVPTGTTEVTVAAQLPGIAPGTLFHYRLVSSHGATSTTYGADATFVTLPWPRPHTGLKLSAVSRGPSSFRPSVTARGRIVLAYTTPGSLGCRGTVLIRYLVGGRTLATVVARVSPTCTFAASARVRNPYAGRVTLTMQARYQGDAYQAPVAGTTRLTVG